MLIVIPKEQQAILPRFSVRELTCKMHAEVLDITSNRLVYDSTVERTAIPRYLGFNMAVHTDMLPVVMVLSLPFHTEPLASREYFQIMTCKYNVAIRSN